MQRRSLLIGTAATLASHVGPTFGQTPPAADETTGLSGKAALIELGKTPPNYETPLSALTTPLTARASFFVHYHLPVVPDRSALAEWALTISGDAAGKSVQLSLDDLKTLPQHELAAVCEAAGNRRSLATPPVAGLQWGLGGMSCALWRGPLLRDVLALAGIAPVAVEIAANGPDRDPAAAYPRYAKSLPIDRATNDLTLIALTINDDELPIPNGYPARLVVPGWSGAYWIKHVNQLEVRSQPLDNPWMAHADRLPAGLFPGSAFPSQQRPDTVPITDLLINSLATSHADGARVRADGFTLSGMAWDNGSGIAEVEIMTSNADTWGTAMLGIEESPYAFRPWSIQIAASRGPFSVQIRAHAKSGASQPDRAVPNPGGYHQNAVQTLNLIAV